LEICADPLSYAKEKIARYNEELHGEKMKIDLKIDFGEKLKPGFAISSKSSQLNIGYFVLQRIYKDLKLDTFFKEASTNRKYLFDANLINRFLTYARILEPASKLGTFDKLENYYEKPTFEYAHIFRFMDVLENSYEEYLSHLFTHSNDIVARDTSVCYFDCTKYYFETETEDDDYILEY
jgi:hypothetical protein